ncbi:MAG: biotin--[acetyl-CoA-carboxylase] ligase [Acidobacteriota bacterium]
MSSEDGGRAGTRLDPEAATERLARLLDGCRLGTRIEWHAGVSSTNDVARERGRSGAPDGALVIAEAQTKGRGRRGRHWHSPPGMGIYVSAVLRPTDPGDDYGAAVQLVAGIAVAETVGPWSDRPPSLVWPNDCDVDGRKLAGVLVEAEAWGSGLDFLVCGIGLNVAQGRSDFPEPIRDLATSLRLLGAELPERVELVARLVRNLAAWEDVARREGLAPVRRRWEELAPGMRDTPVVLDTVEGEVAGRAQGLTPRGGLRVRTDAGPREVLVGELVRVRRDT